jgi:hypothetical protein
MRLRRRTPQRHRPRDHGRGHKDMGLHDKVRPVPLVGAATHHAESTRNWLEVRLGTASAHRKRAY